MGLRATSGIEWLQQWGCRDVAATWYGMRFVGGIKKKRRVGARVRGGGAGGYCAAPVRNPHDTASNRAVTKRGKRSPFFSGCTAHAKPTIRQDIPTAAPRPGSHLYDEGAGAAAAASGALGVEAPTGVGARPANRLTENNRAGAEGRGRGGERDVRQRSQVPSPQHAQAQGLD